MVCTAANLHFFCRKHFIINTLEEAKKGIKHYFSSCISDQKTQHIWVSISIENQPVSILLSLQITFNSRIISQENYCILFIRNFLDLFKSNMIWKFFIYHIKLKHDDRISDYCISLILLGILLGQENKQTRPA